MNWNAHGYSTVDKERIWKEFVKGEDTRRHVYDQFRPNVTERSREPDIKISPRGKKFLEKPVVAPKGIYNNTTTSTTSANIPQPIPNFSTATATTNVATLNGTGGTSPRLPTLSPRQLGVTSNSPRHPLHTQSPPSSKMNGYSPSNSGNTRNTTKPTDPLSTMRLASTSSHDVGNCFRSSMGEQTARITSPLRQPIRTEGGHSLFDFGKKKRHGSIVNVPTVVSGRGTQSKSQF